MPVPIPVLPERPSVSSAGRESRFKKLDTYPVKGKFAQNLARAVKKQNPAEVSQGNNSTNSMVESQPTTSMGKRCQAKEDGSTGDLRSQEPEQKEGIPPNKNELEAMVNQPVMIELALTHTVAAQNPTEAAEEFKISQASSQPAEGSEPGAIVLMTRETSDQINDIAGRFIQADNGKIKTTEPAAQGNSVAPLVTTIAADDSGVELKPNQAGIVYASQNADQQEAGQTLITKMPHGNVVKENASQGREPEKDNSPLSPVVEKTDTQTSTDVKKIMAMESHISSGKVTMVKANAEEMGDNNSQSESGQEAPKFNLLQNQTDNLQVRVTNSKAIDLPVKEPVDSQDLIQQIVKKAEVLLKSDISEMKMQLKPEFLGKMLIKVTVEEGTVVTKIITENQHVKQVLEANLNSLRQNLEANGMKVEKTEVSVQLFNDGGGSYNESDSNRYPFWSEQQGQNRRSYPDSTYGLLETENLPDLAEETVKYGIGSEGQVNYLI